MLPSSHPAPMERRPRPGFLPERAALDAHLALDAATAPLRAELAASRAAQGAAALEMERLRGRLAASQTALASLAHEIRNPLASMELFAGLLEQEPARAGQWLGQLRAGLRSLGATVDNVLAFGRGEQALRLEPAILSEAVLAAAEFAKPLIAQGGLDLHVVGSALRNEVQADPEALRRLILNLVANAVRHTPSPGKIAILIERARASHLRLTVRDTGAGIAPEHLPHIFTPGWSASGRSTGLGLAIAQRIAAQHGTVLHVQSTLGEGTVFSMELKTLEFETL